MSTPSAAATDPRRLFFQGSAFSRVSPDAMKIRTKIVLSFLFLLLFSIAPAFALISVGFMNKDEAKEAGITMKSRSDGDAGTKVWIEFKKEGFLKDFTYAELQITDAQGKHRVSARLEPVAVVHGQPKDVITLSFSADPAELENCAFFVVAYGSSRGDVGYVLKVKDFIELAKK